MSAWTDSEAMAMDYSNAQDVERRGKAVGKAVSSQRSAVSQSPAVSSSKMSSRQRFKYLMAWRRLCLVKGWSEGDAKVRHELVNDILVSSGGEEKRFHDFSQPDYGVVMWTMWEMIAGRLPTVDQLRAMRDDERRKNLMFVIGKLARQYGDQPTRTLLLNRFKCISVEALAAESLETLEQVRRTLTARTYEPKKAVSCQPSAISQNETAETES